MTAVSGGVATVLTGDKKTTKKATVSKTWRPWAEKKVAFGLLPNSVVGHLSPCILYPVRSFLIVQFQVGLKKMLNDVPRYKLNNNRWSLAIVC